MSPGRSPDGHHNPFLVRPRRSARGRVAHLACELFVRLSATGRTDGGGYTLPMTQADMSDVLGLGVVHVNRVLQGLRGDKLLQLKGRDPVILDWSGLRDAAEFRPDHLHGGGADGLDVVHGPAPRTVPPSRFTPGTAER